VALPVPGALVEIEVVAARWTERPRLHVCRSWWRRAFAAKLRSAAVAVVARRYAGMVHGFAGLPQITPAATQAIDDLAGDIRRSLA